MKTEARDFSLRRNIATLGVALLLTGCTTLYDGKYDFREGWREARVNQIAAASQIQRPDFFKCIRNATPQQRGSQSFAVLSYRRFGKTVLTAMPLSSASKLQVRDSVYVNLSSCDAPIVQRSSYGRNISSS